MTSCLLPVRGAILEWLVVKVNKTRRDAEMETRKEDKQKSDPTVKRVVTDDYQALSKYSIITTNEKTITAIKDKIEDYVLAGNMSITVNQNEWTLMSEEELNMGFVEAKKNYKLALDLAIKYNLVEYKCYVIIHIAKAYENEGEVIRNLNKKESLAQVTMYLSRAQFNFAKAYEISPEYYKSKMVWLDLPNIEDMVTIRPK